MKKLFLAIFGFALLAIGYIHISIQWPTDAHSEKQVVFEVEAGSSLKSISQQLAKEELVRSATIFEVYAKLTEIDTKFKAGRFVLSPSMNFAALSQILTNNGESSALRITILEGQTVQDIDDRLVQLNLIEPLSFVSAVNNFDNFSRFTFISQQKTEDLPMKLEGYLFPDTYFVDPLNFKNEDFITSLLENFENKALPILQENSSKRSTHELITMASIIELEAKGPSDSYIISDILWKRVDEGWFMGADATSLYLKNSNIITNKTLQEASPYNTRKHQKGLTPGPIGNPGLLSIKAALSPEPSNYRYYLHSPDGRTHYATTNDEHNRNRAIYLK